MNELLKQIPESLQGKFEDLQVEIDDVIKRAEKFRSTKIPGKFSFRYESSAPRGILTDYERAQSVSFVTRYESLPVVENVHIVEYGGLYYLSNIDFIRYALNEYRAIIQNRSDSVFYQNIHRFCRQKIINRDKSKDIVITVKHKTKVDITPIFAAYLDEQCKAIRVIVDSCDYSYIYNGILQHSDHKFTRRFLKEYSSGSINYTFVKHAQLLGCIKEYLYWHYKLLNVLTFPKLGPL